MLSSVFKGRGLRERVLRGIGSGDLYDRLIRLTAERNGFQRLLASKENTPPDLEPGSGRWGFIHIPKTGGTSVAETLRRTRSDIVGASLTQRICKLPELFKGRSHYCRPYSLLHVWMGKTPPNACDGVARSSGTCCIVLPICTGKPTALRT